MAVKKIEKEEWQSFFDNFSKKYLKDEQPEYAEIRVLSNESGAQAETGWVPLEGITYNPKDGMLYIKVEELNRMIWNPREIYVDEDEEGWIESFEIIESDDTRDIVQIR